ncbi:MAG: hypothetical protein JWL82_560 [Parcubacteria group bacterium]|nr:hypothetical protein [Parcubacteria group bacterium]
MAREDVGEPFYGKGGKTPKSRMSIWTKIAIFILVLGVVALLSQLV